jgi:hypothetical protein
LTEEDRVGRTLIGSDLVQVSRFDESGAKNGAVSVALAFFPRING